MKTETQLAATNRMALHRASMKSQGLRQVQAWIIDTRSDSFQQEARKQSLLTTANQAHEEETLNWLEQIADTNGWK